MARSAAAAPPILSIALMLLFLAAAAFSSTSGGSGSELSLGTWAAAAGSSGCRGSVGECLAGSEFELGDVAEATRRVLAGYHSHYISYGALDRNRVPCSRRGASYYNCRPGARRNPYRRGCSAITRCRW